eukprot:709156-Rhodomonas_salina.1
MPASRVVRLPRKKSAIDCCSVLVGTGAEPHVSHLISLAVIPLQAAMPPLTRTSVSEEGNKHCGAMCAS